MNDETDDLPEATPEEPQETQEVPQPEIDLDQGFRFNEIVNQVLRGEWGTGQERRRRLSEAGHDHAAIQKEIVRRMNNKQ